MDKTAQSEFPILDVVASRWSPRAFAPTSIDAADVHALFEAARWAASSFNEQPWSFIVVRRDDEGAFARALGCLTPRNALWAGRAGALVFSVARATFSRNDKPNRHAWYDVGQAVANLALQATALGLAVHQMAGFSADATREAFGVPDGWEPVSAIAVGYPGRVDDLDESFRESELAPRSRKPQVDFVFDGRWGEPAR